MQLKIFWNKAIEYYCTYKRSDSKEGFDTVFIAIAEESLGQIKEKFIKYSGLDEQEIKLVEGNISKVGGIIDSYYSAVKEVHNEQGNPAQFSFLRFSILVVGAFKQDDSPLRNYWIDFDPFLVSRNIPVIINRTDYLKKIEINLTKWCKTQHNKTFFNLNVFGEESKLVNVGRIKAHSVFQGRTLEKIKKSIYSLGYSESHSIEDLTFDDVEKIITDSELIRILNLFKGDEDAKEIVYACLKIWLKNWIPSQEEKVRLLEGKTSTGKAPLSIHRLWSIDPENLISNIEIKFGFIYKSELGEDTLYYLNREKNVFVDTTWGIKLADNRILYEINNYQYNIDLNDNELGLHFEMIKPEVSKSNYALEKIPIRNRYTFIEHFKKKIISKENPFVLATKTNVKSEKLRFFHKAGLEDNPQNVFNLFRIVDTFNFADLDFIVTDDIEISIIGVTDGRKGVKSFASFFPIKLKIGSALKGDVQLFVNDNVFNSYPLSSLYNILSTEIDVGLLEKGEYSIKYFVNDSYVYFDNGQDSIKFEIVDSGIGDRRIEAQEVGVETFKYHEFRRLKEFESLESDAVIFNNDERVFDFGNQYFDFYFIKDEDDSWIDISDERNSLLRRKLSKPEFFLHRKLLNPAKVNPSYSQWPVDLVYLDTKFNQFKYSILFSERPIDVNLFFNINEYFIKDEECKIINKYATLKCYSYKLTKMDDKLMDKYPNVKLRDEVFVLSNKIENTKPEKLIQLINQEFFPFKK